MTITLTREEAQQVLDALEYYSFGFEVESKLIETLRTRLAQPEPKNKALTHEENKAHNQKILDEFYKENAALYEPDPVVGKEYYAKLCERVAKTWKDNDANLPPELKLPWLSAEECAVAIRASTRINVEPVAWRTDKGATAYCNADFAKSQGWTPIYPPQRKWQGLTDKERNDCLVEADPCEALLDHEAHELMRTVEAKLKEKNGG